MIDQFYIVGASQNPIGPFTVKQLKLRAITPDTLVFAKGLNGWTKAKDVPELAPLFEHIQETPQEPTATDQEEKPETKSSEEEPTPETKNTDEETNDIKQVAISLIAVFVIGAVCGGFTYWMTL